MSVHELNQDQIEFLKREILISELEKQGKQPSWGELAEVNSLVTDKEVLAEYDDTDFCEEDFWN